MYIVLFLNKKFTFDESNEFLHFLLLKKKKVNLKTALIENIMVNDFFT